ncbi:ASCH domain-containing protein [Pseudomonas entomophila]|uniref:ASCH domain-containing protein n=1 Tax=Pseudomonas entomophila TaxID=312306 RepID=UPI0023D801CC|nr:ASCH domain-containing protein [Pseudomonas entomophila]MDF0733033.1 ASCH domain-containing protein [Pseudomonas entomophila]
MQSLEIVPRLLPEVRSGRKQHTIRWRERNVVPGPMLYVNSENSCDTLVVWVTQVETMPLRSVARYLNRTGEWPDPVLLEGMREHYPEINLDSEVEVIHHFTPGSRQS